MMDKPRPINPPKRGIHSLRRPPREEYLTPRLNQDYHKTEAIGFRWSVQEHGDDD